MIDVAVLIDKLNGMSSKDIVEFFEGEGIKGEQKNAGGCPIANWILRNSAASDVEVDEVLKVNDSYNDEEVETQYKLDVGPCMFIHEFDAGQYPQLESPIEDYD
jgi:hypothetical protein